MAYDPNSLNPDLRIFDSIDRTKKSLNCIRDAWQANHTSLSLQSADANFGNHATIKFTARTDHPNTGDNLYVNNNRLYFKSGAAQQVEIASRNNSSNNVVVLSYPSFSGVINTRFDVKALKLTAGSFSYVDEGNGFRSFWGQGWLPVARYSIGVIDLVDANGNALLTRDQEIFAVSSFNLIPWQSDTNHIPTTGTLPIVNSMSAEFRLLTDPEQSSLRSTSRWLISSNAPISSSTTDTPRAVKWSIRGRV